MQELAIIISSIAGVATAAAIRKGPRSNFKLLSLGASSQIKNQINSLKIEKVILTKTIARLYQADSFVSKIQRDQLLMKYQHQLGIILARLEKLEESSNHPDLGPIGDGLITLMDHKLAKLDNSLHELSSKISMVNQSAPKESKMDESSIKKEGKSEHKKEKFTNTLFNFEKAQNSKPDPIVIPATNSKHSIELTTLTQFSNKEPKFQIFNRQNNLEQKIIVDTEKSKENFLQDIAKPNLLNKRENAQSVVTKPEINVKPEIDINKEFAKITKHKALPEPETIVNKITSIEDDFDDDDDDLDIIKGEILKVLSKIDQAEVE